MLSSGAKVRYQSAPVHSRTLAPEERGIRLTPDEEFAAFVRGHIRTNWGVELLMLLKRDPGRSWPAGELVRELRASAGIVGDSLNRFERAGLALQDERGWRYAPAAPALAKLCDDLEAAYRQRPVAVLNLIARPTDPVQTLADAFKFKKGGE